MNNLKELLKKLDEQKTRLASRKTYVLEYDAIELEFINTWSKRKTVYKDDELNKIDGLLKRIDRLSLETGSLLDDIEHYQQTGISEKEMAEDQKANYVSAYLQQMNEIMERIKSLSADCDALIGKLPEDLAIGTY